MKIGTIKGIQIKLHISTLLIVGLVGFYVAQYYFFVAINPTILELILIGLINGFLILLSILIHEIFHSVVAQGYGLKVSEIELYVFGGASKIEEEPHTPLSEIIIAGVGPLSSLFIGAIFLLFLYLPINYNLFISVTLYYVGITNLLLGIFNLLPGFPMDGGRILRSLIWYKRKDFLSATKTASKVGNFFGYLLIFFGIYWIFFINFLGGFWFIIIGFFLNNAAKQEYFQTLTTVTLSKTIASDILTVKNFPIDFYTSVKDAVQHYFLKFKTAYFPVVLNDKIVGLVYFEDIRKISLVQQAEISVGNIMHPINEYPSIHEDDSGELAYKKLRSTHVKPHVVLVKDKDEEHIMGFIDDDNINFILRYAKT